ncbi:hypothetical protein cypCar_00034958 [Cyprinus carpio]|nr:hypothetical protein cypCar_00034958 [Cyprinus carpio]
MLASCLLFILPSCLYACPMSCICPSPKEVHCTFRHLPSVPRNLPQDTEKLNLGFFFFFSHYNSIGTVGSSDFANLRQLEMLMLHGDDISSLSSGSFYHLRSLQILKLSYNKLKRVHLSLFEGLTSLEEAQRGVTVSKGELLLFESKDSEGSGYEEIKRPTAKLTPQRVDKKAQNKDVTASMTSEVSPAHYPLSESLAMAITEDLLKVAMTTFRKDVKLNKFEGKTKHIESVQLVSATSLHENEAVPATLATPRQINSLQRPITTFPNGTLRILRLTEKDGGNYLCMYQRPNGEDMELFQVEVLMRPAKIENTWAQHKRVANGDNFLVDCVASGLPDPEVLWSLPDGTMINNALQSDDSGTRNRCYIIFGNGTLLLQQMGKKDEGNYTFYAKNTLGEDAMKVSVQVVSNLPQISSK